MGAHGRQSPVVVEEPPDGLQAPLWVPGGQAADGPAHQEPGVVPLLLEGGLPSQYGQLGEDGLEEGDPPGLGEHQVGLGHVVVHTVGEAHHLDVPVAPRQLVTEPLVAPVMRVVSTPGRASRAS